MSNDRGRNRFTSDLEPARRAALESFLLPVDHPDLWSDDALERMYAQRVCDARRLEADGLADRMGDGMRRALDFHRRGLEPAV